MAKTILSVNPLPVNTKTIYVCGRAYEIARITLRCWALTASKTGAVRTFNSETALLYFVGDLALYLKSKTQTQQSTPRPAPLTKAQKAAREDFLDQAERYFKLVAEVTNARVGHYTHDNYEWQINNARLAAGQAASRYVQFVSQGV
jgi:hypothetical protein